MGCDLYALMVVMISLSSVACSSSSVRLSSMKSVQAYSYTTQQKTFDYSFSTVMRVYSDRAISAEMSHVSVVTGQFQLK